MSTLSDYESDLARGGRESRRWVLREGVVVGLANHTVLTARDGTNRPVADRAAPIKDNGGYIQGVVLVFHDVSEKYAAEKSLREEQTSGANGRGRPPAGRGYERVLAAVVESSDDAIIGKMLDGVITSWNQAAERTLGDTADEMVGKHISTLMPPEHSEDTTGILERIRRGERVGHFETKRLTKDGRIIDVSLSVSPIRHADGTIIGGIESSGTSPTASRLRRSASGCSPPRRRPSPRPRRPTA